MNEPSPTLEIPCPECGDLVEIEREHIGRKGKCPSCGHKFVIEEPKKEPEPAAEEREEGEPQPAQKPKAKKVMVAKCPQCEFEVEVPEDMDGRKGQCPACEHKFVIEIVKRERKKTKKKRKRTKPREEEELDPVELAKEEIQAEEKRRFPIIPLVSLAAAIILGGVIWFLISQQQEKQKEEGTKSNPEDVQTTPGKSEKVEESDDGLDPFAFLRGDENKTSPTPDKSSDPTPETKNRSSFSAHSVTASSPYLMVHANQKDFTDANTEELRPILEKIVWLNLNDTKITDESLSIISTMNQLTRLQLKQCQITDDGVSRLTSLSSLRSLNLAECPQITDACLEALPPTTTLRSLNLKGTSITPEAVSKLKEQLPQLTIHIE